LKDLMRIFAVDTTTTNGSGAVLEDGRVLATFEDASPSTHSARLLSSIDIMLATLGIGIRDIDGFAVTPGPGSFTGIRIGLSTVKAFAFASGRPVAPVSSLSALAWKFRDNPCFAAPMLDAKKGEIYAALFRVEPGGLHELVPQGAYAPDRFLELIPRDRPIVLIGSGIAVCGGRIAEALGPMAQISTLSPFIASEVGLLGLEILAAGGGITAEALEPLYFRKSQAEDKH
jgi:tRNA threonylcarbamoyladenosine biosynthesis protein TsaB